jgi:uncharacterized protein
MRLDHSFVAPAPAARVWAVLADAARAAPLLPGLELTDVAEDRCAGTLQVKVGPVVLRYRGSGRFLRRDPATRRFLVEAAGQDVHGGGTVAAVVAVALREQAGGRTRVEVSTELVVTGRLARAGRRLVQHAGLTVLAGFIAALNARFAAVDAETGAETGTGNAAQVLAQVAAGVDAEAGGAGRTGAWRGGPRPIRGLLRGAVTYLGTFLLGGLFAWTVMRLLG